MKRGCKGGRANMYPPCKLQGVWGGEDRIFKRRSLNTQEQLWGPLQMQTITNMGCKEVRGGSHSLRDPKRESRFKKRTKKHLHWERRGD